MLNLLYKFGVRLEQSDDNDKILISLKKLKLDNKLNYKTASILIDLDTNNVIIDTTKIADFDKDTSIKKLLVTQTKGANFKEISTSFVFEKFYCFSNIVESKNGKETGLLKVIKKFLPEYQNRLIYKVADLIAKNFINFKYFTSLPNKLEEMSYEDFISNPTKFISLGNKEKILIYYIEIKCTEFNFTTPILLASVDGYLDLIKEIFLPSKGDKKSLCYVSGEMRDNTTKVTNILNANLTKIYQTTKYHHVVDFDKNNLGQNFSISKEARDIIGAAERYLKENLEFKIAGTKTTLIPELPIDYSGDIYLTTNNFRFINDLVFNEKIFEANITNTLKFDTVNKKYFVFHYIGHFSKNQGEKITTRISDVKCNHLINLFQIFKNHASFYQGSDTVSFNLETLYRMVPERKDMEIKKSMKLIKLILEKQKINAKVLFEYFVELYNYYIYCRKENYDNIWPVANEKREKNHYKIKTAIIKYLILFRTLIDLKLLTNHNFKEYTMENEDELREEITPEDLFAKHKYCDQHIAMFYLGRIVNKIATAQYKANHKNKPILNKINSNGITKDDIIKLHNALFEKANQYKISDKIFYEENKFINYFNFNSWKLDPKEALFVLLSGYYFTQKKFDNDSNDNVTGGDDETTN